MSAYHGTDGEWKMSEELRVPKRRAQVEVLLPSGGARQVVVFLAEFASSHSGPERLSDLLNGGGDFLPALDMATEEMSFLNRHGVAAARVSEEWEPGDDFPAPQQHDVEITLMDGTVLGGRVEFVLPAERSRLLDYLNAWPPFLRLVEKDRVALVNKRQIARVTRLK
jgi:hypothetical protein